MLTAVLSGWLAMCTAYAFMYETIVFIVVYRNVCFPCEEQCSMYRCTEQTTQHLGYLMIDRFLELESCAQFVVK